MIRRFSVCAAAIALTACANITSPDVARDKARGSVSDIPNAWSMASERVGPVEAGWLTKLDDPRATALLEQGATLRATDGGWAYLRGLLLRDPDRYTPAVEALMRKTPRRGEGSWLYFNLDRALRNAHANGQD